MDSVAQDWGATGLAFLTGMPDGPPDFSRAAALAEARRVAAHLGARIGVDLDAAALLAGPPAVLSCAAELGADNALVDRMIAERRFAPC